MSIPLEAHTWDKERLLQEIAIRLPKGWAFEFGQLEDQLWWVRILDADANIVWVNNEVAPNLTLLNAVGWLDLRVNKVPKGSPWAPRTDSPPLSVHELAFRARGVDPEDLDPEQIKLVYSQHPRKR